MTIDPSFGMSACVFVLGVMGMAWAQSRFNTSVLAELKELRDFNAKQRTINDGLIDVCDIYKDQFESMAGSPTPAPRRTEAPK